MSILISPLFDMIMNVSNSIFLIFLEKQCMVKIKLNILNSCSSTNDIAFKAAQLNTKEGASYLSYEQTNGRGRNNNQWK